jgi:alpha-L-fucosidase 2
MAYRILLSSVLIFSVTTSCLAQVKPLRLWYDKPAKQWEETIPVGNGRLGMMSDGGVLRENIVLNDITLWSGGPQDANNYEAHKSLPEIRRLLLEGKNDEAQKLVNENFVAKGAGSGHGDGANVPFGCYQVLGNLHMQFAYKGVDTSAVSYQNYKRELSLDDAVASLVYTVGGVTYRREYFTSFGDDAGLIRLTADKPGSLNLRLALDRPERFQTVVKNNMLEMSGQLNNGTDGKGMKYLTRIRPQLKGGKMNASGNQIIIQDADEVLLYFAAGTDFKTKNFEADVLQVIDAAMQKSYAAQKQTVLPRVISGRRINAFPLFRNNRTKIPACLFCFSSMDAT